MIPDSINGVTIRRLGDGIIALPRKNAAAEEYLDKHAIRIKGELKWREKPSELYDKVWAQVAQIFHHPEVYIVGKGPSLDNIKASDFKAPTIPVICINEAIHKVESLDIPNPIFCLQQDKTLGRTCEPKRGYIFISTQAAKFYEGFDRAIIYMPQEYGLGPGTLSLICAIAICRKLGVDSFKLLCFDAHVNGATEYAECIGHKADYAGHPGSRFLFQKESTNKALEGCHVEWIIPE